MSKRVRFDEGMAVKEKGYKHKGKLEKEYKNIVGEKRKLRDSDDALFALQRTDAGVKFVDGLKKKGINVKKIKEDILKEKMKTKEFRMGHAKSKVAGKKVNEDDQEYKLYNKGGRATFKVGGAAKRGVSKILRKK